jgi:hypothetical protein
MRPSAGDDGDLLGPGTACSRARHVRELRSAGSPSPPARSGRDVNHADQVVECNHHAVPEQHSRQLTCGPGSVPRRRSWRSPSCQIDRVSCSDSPQQSVSSGCTPPGTERPERQRFPPGARASQGHARPSWPGALRHPCEEPWMATTRERPISRRTREMNWKRRSRSWEVSL